MPRASAASSWGPERRPDRRPVGTAEVGGDVTGPGHTGPVAGPTILHVDMDAFYAAVEVRDDPSLAGLPLVVGGSGPRGVVASCSYEARTYGIRSAMPSARARSLCPRALFLAGRFDRYQEVSAAIHAVFDDVTPLVEGIALDEAFLDVGGAERILGPAAEIAAGIRTRIADEVGLACSVGVAPSKFLAKLGSEAAKPTVSGGMIEPGPGVVVIEPGEELTFLHPLPVEALWGVGPATSARLRRLGITTVGSLAEVPPATLDTAVGRVAGRHLHRLANGIDERRVEPVRAAKSVGHEETYAVDRRDGGGLHTEVLRMSDAVAARLRRSDTAGRTITLKVRYGDFTTITRSRTVATGVDAPGSIATVAGDLLDAVDLSPGIRLLGVSVSNLAPRQATTALQLHLGFDTDPDPPPPADLDPADLDQAAGSAGAPSRRGPSADEVARSDAAADAVEAVRRRFGRASVASAALLGPDGLRIKRPGDTQWGPTEERHIAPPDRDPLP